MIKTLTKVNSSMVYAVGYDPDEELLEVVFTSGKIWGYENVPKEEYKSLINSRSIGSYMKENIIDCYPDFSIS
ncbi:MAG: hypothetical protein SCARUB_01977 [Candidatus Scalindua rubra]|uniref:KTSC domain-containing protein n=1 Tax=Candidatus Scalindua rubra TaxID=1872076 RepID=A0A1E3XB61_9BACT|nr:MAG: hypothetical protein SCARUB_01977 [Candidatus Scalindua rubra]